MLEKVKNTIKKYNMIIEGDTVVIGVSGGADSICLLHILNSIKNEYNFNIYVIHIHHGLRGKDADRDSKYVEEICKSFNIDYEIKYKDIIKESKKFKISQEEAGRVIRYKEFENLAKKINANKIATAHHMNDQAETIIHNIIRGTGLKGLTGIPPTRGTIIRPLIECSKQEIEDYCKSLSIDYMEDYTNRIDDYTRNKIRLNLIPYIEENFNPSFVRQLVGMSSILREEEKYMSDLSLDAYKLSLVEEKTDKIIFDLDKLKIVDKVILKRLLRLGISKLVGLKDIENKHIELIEELLFKGTGKRVDLPNNIYVLTNYNKLEIKIKKVEQNNLWEYTVSEIPAVFRINECNHYIEFKLVENKKNVNFPKNVYTKWFDYDKIIYNLKVRNRRPGDYVILKGVSGKKKIKDYYIDEKIPKELRNSIPLLCDDSNIIWIIGHRISEEYKVTDNTVRILEVKYYKEETNAR